MMSSAYPFKNLVFQGGGVKTFAYLGALDVLEAEGILPQIQRVAGASAGAMLGMLVSFRLSAAEISDRYASLEFSKVPGLRRAQDVLGTVPDFLALPLNSVIGNTNALDRLVNRFGWYSTEYAYEWLQGVIAEQCDGNRRATFAEFRERGFLDLYVVATDISARTARTFSAKHTPDAAVADALRMSASIPLFFEALRFNGNQFGEGNFYADGGVLDNFPMRVFDHPDFGEDNPHYQAMVNGETLGCRLYTPADCDWIQARHPISNLIDYIEALLETILEAQVVAFDNNPADRLRTININDCCVQATDFEVQPDANNLKYMQLLAEGRKAAADYLRQYAPAQKPPFAFFMPRRKKR
jgi:NTE family protein